MPVNADPRSTHQGDALDQLKTASGHQGGDVTAQGHFQIALANAAFDTLDDLAALRGFSGDRVGEITVLNNTNRRCWVQYVGSTDKLDLDSGAAITFAYATWSDITIGNDSGGGISVSDPPVRTLSCYFRGVVPVA